MGSFDRLAPSRRSPRRRPNLASAGMTIIDTVVRTRAGLAEGAGDEAGRHAASDNDEGELTARADQQGRFEGDARRQAKQPRQAERKRRFQSDKANRAGEDRAGRIR